MHYCEATLDEDENDVPIRCLKEADFIVMSEFNDDAREVCPGHVTSFVPIGGTLFVMWIRSWLERPYDPSMT